MAFKYINLINIKKITTWTRTDGLPIPTVQAIMRTTSIFCCTWWFWNSFYASADIWRLYGTDQKFGPRSGPTVSHGPWPTVREDIGWKYFLLTYEMLFAWSFIFTPCQWWFSSLKKSFPTFFLLTSLVIRSSFLLQITRFTHGKTNWTTTVSISTHKIPIFNCYFFTRITLEFFRNLHWRFVRPTIYQPVQNCTHPLFWNIKFNVWSGGHFWSVLRNF